MKMQSLSFAVIASVCLFSNAAYAEPPRYKITDVGNLGGSFTRAVDINNAGDVVGTSSDSSEVKHAFLYRDGVIHNLGKLDGVRSEAININSAGTVLVSVSKSDNTIVPALYRDGALVSVEGELAALARLSGFKLVNINDNDVILAERTDPATGVTHIYVRNADGSVLDLAESGINMHVADINNHNQIIGWITVPGIFRSHNHVMLYDNGVLTELATGNTTASALNDYGQGVGRGVHGNLTGPAPLALMYLNEGPFVIGTTRSGYSGSGARDVNNVGTAVGYDWVSCCAKHAFVYHVDFGIRDLMDLGRGGMHDWKRFEDAAAINDAGQIVGYGYKKGAANGDEPKSAFLLTPVE